MIERRAYPTSANELLASLRAITAGASSIVMQAGHFLVYYDIVEDRLLPCVAGELTSPRHEILRRHAGHFPLLTWDLGLWLLEQLDAPRKHAMVVVNDWQHVPKDIDRRRFYRDFPHLPGGYQERLEAAGGQIGLLQPAVKIGTGVYFGEMNLRNQYKKAVDRLIATGTLPPHAVMEQFEQDIVCSLIDQAGRKQEVYCSSKTSDCAAEIAQMLRIARQQVSCDCFVNLYPVVCQEFVERGTELSQELFGNDIPSVVNIGFPTADVMTRDDLFASCAMAIHDLTARVPSI